MKLIVGLLACLFLPLISQITGTPTNDLAHDKSTVLQKQRADELSRERARSKADLCAHLGNCSDYAVGNCWLQQGKTTDVSYTVYVRSTGALLRLSLHASGHPPAPKGQPQDLEFDTAEATWLSYRQQTCNAMIEQWEGGTLGRIAYPKCLVTVTWDHMNELDGLYSDL